MSRLFSVNCYFHYIIGVLNCGPVDGKVGNIIRIDCIKGWRDGAALRDPAIRGKLGPVKFPIVILANLFVKKLLIIFVKHIGSCSCDILN